FLVALLSRHASKEEWSSHVVQTWISSNSSVFSLMSTSIRTKPSNVWTDFALLNFSATSSAVPFLRRMVFTALIISYPPVFIISYALIMIEKMQLFHHGSNLNNMCSFCDASICFLSHVPLIFMKNLEEQNQQCRMEAGVCDKMENEFNNNSYTTKGEGILMGNLK